MYILGISAYYHDSAACLLQDGVIISAVQEERFTRKKHDPSFPSNSIEYCLKKAEITLADVNFIVFYDKPLLKFERLLETYLAYVPHGFKSFVTAMPVWLKEKLFLKRGLKKELSKISGLTEKNLPHLLFTEHHQSHASSAFFPSPFDKAIVLCLDGVGEWATSSVWIGDNNKLTPQWEINFPHSLGLLYSAFTYYAGFKVNSGEYKLMGLAPYGEPNYVDLIMNNLIDVKDDGSFRLEMSYFDFATGLTMTNNKFNKLFGGKPRITESEITKKEMDLACSIQVVTETIVLRIALTAKNELGIDYLCLAGGVALNCVSNGRLLSEGVFKDIWIQPAAGDAGGAIGAAYSVWHEYLDSPREVSANDLMQGAYLGPSYTNTQIIDFLDSKNIKYEYLCDAELMQRLAKLLDSEHVVGWFQGRMEFGPRALGNRSIIGDPRSKKMQSVMNLKIKYRESFRPFAPSVKSENVSEWFTIYKSSPYMLFVAHVKESKRQKVTSEDMNLFGINKLKAARSQIPAVTHVDYSARIQTVHSDTNPRYYSLLSAFENETGCPILVNTSFNVRGEPIVNTPEDAYYCFMHTDIDYLVMENIFLDKQRQPDWQVMDEIPKTLQLD